MEILYSSRSVLRRIRYVLGNPTKQDRRVVLVAYVGSGVEKLLAPIKGLEVVCTLEPGATNPTALRWLLREGAFVQTSRRLHMKVYWSKQKGCVITSANASMNALGPSPRLLEAGIFVGPGLVDISRFLRLARPQDITSRMIHKLDLLTSIRRGRLGFANEELPHGGGEKRGNRFLDWCDLEPRSKWKLGWTNLDDEIVPAESVTTRLKYEFGVNTPAALTEVAMGTAKEGDWLMCYFAGPKDVSEFRWLHVDFVASVSQQDTAAWNEDFPYQAVQVDAVGAYGPPPFRIDASFRRAFSAAALRFGLDSETVCPSESLSPRRQLVEAIIRELRS